MKVVEVDVGARLHFGFLDLNGSLGRIFGGIGVGIEEPRTTLVATSNDALEAVGPDSARALKFAGRFMGHFDLKEGVLVRISSSIPPHVGLGSGTRLALAVGKALSTLFDIDTSIEDLANIMGRSKRSSVGTVSFERGGFVLDGGHRKEGIRGFPPLLFHTMLPIDWFFVVVVPMSLRGTSGNEEDKKFKQLKVREEVSSKICRIVLMSMLPSILEEDVRNFGSAVSEVQRLMGECFSSIQGGNFISPLSEEIASFMESEGAFGVGQSSWGPTVYGVVEGYEAAHELSLKLQKVLRDESMIFVSSCAHEGAKVEVRGDRFDDF